MTPRSRRSRVRSLLATPVRVAVGAAILATPALAGAQQLDTNPPSPNVMLLLDTSGSMERMIDGSLPESKPSSTCNIDPTGGTIIAGSSQPTPNRWGTLVQALTGTFRGGYNCAALPRTTTGTFGKEYQIAGVQPYDNGYYLPYHRPIFNDPTTTSQACEVAPGVLPGATGSNGVGPSGAGVGGGYATDFPANGIVLRKFGDTATTTSPASGLCGGWPGNEFTSYQYSDGAIPSSSALMRFGLMTFDQDPDPGIGVTPNNKTTSLTVNPVFTGQWSYFPSWNSGGSCPYSGDPVNCAVPQLFAVGARNRAAPPWEGRMMPFPSTSSTADQANNNNNIASVILATRPYGATPIAGMMTNAKYYLWSDTEGPQNTDALVSCGARKQYLILLTDGVPNLDLRASALGLDPANANVGGCDSTPPTGGTVGKCPFDLPEDIAKALYQGNGSQHSVTTFVIGFAVSAVADAMVTTQCSSLVNSSTGTIAATCANPPDAFKACCQLQKIAVSGSGGQYSAFFADTPGDLQKALAKIIAIIGQESTTRTVPAYSPAPSSVFADTTNATSVGATFLATFNPTAGQPWTGNVLRRRQTCTPQSGSFLQATEQPDSTKGDDFAANVNSNSGNARTFIAFQPDIPATGPVDATATIRPYVSATVSDGMGKYSATTVSGGASAVIPSITSAAMAIKATSPNCQYSSKTNLTAKTLTVSQCTTMALDYVFAQPTFTADPGDFPFVSRSGRAIGDIYHATPSVVGAPGSLLDDASYTSFAGLNASRPTVVYAATNDGILHAFDANVSKLTNNELWAMVPPAVMPNILPSYPSSHSFLLDGAPVVKDVAWDRSTSNATSGSPWHTMLVAGFGSTQRGYYAVDVTDPVGADIKTANANGQNGPSFRWQLTSVPSTNFPIFAAQSGTPAITTLYFNPDGTDAREIGVAILPGGSDGPAPTSAKQCARATKTTAEDSGPTSITDYKARTSVRCWGKNNVWTDPVNGRAVTIVRLDTGEIMRVFARKADVTTAPYASDTVNVAGRVNYTNLDSPMTGTPIVYPNDVGTPATKFFITDADGTLWRFDVSNPDPSLWQGSVFLDLYNNTADINGTSWAEGQPVQVNPTLSLDSASELVLNVATGATDTFDTSGINYVYSITEKVQGSPAKFRAFVNWYLGSPSAGGTAKTIAQYQANVSKDAFNPGERISGPMLVFNGVLYFATYAAAQPQVGSTTCSNSTARLWGLDFVTPDPAGGCTDPTSATCNRYVGGTPRLIAPVSTSPIAYYVPFYNDPDHQNSVIPGLSIQATPACASAGTGGNDAYVPGVQHSAPQNFTAGSYSIFSQVGGGTSGSTNASTLSVNVPTPASPTGIDSWAGVLE